MITSGAKLGSKAIFAGILVGMLLVSLFAGVATAIGEERVATGPVHNLDKDTYYETIQAAIDDANSGDRIFVSSGTYYENVVISKSISLIGESKSTTSIDGGSSSDVLYITGRSSVNITEIAIMNGSFLTGYDFFYRGGCGIRTSVSQVLITNCTILDNPIGIYSKYSFCRVRNSQVINNGWGVYSHGGRINISDSPVINNGCGLYSYGGRINATNCSISDNSIGVYLYSRHGGSRGSITYSKILNNIYGICTISGIFSSSVTLNYNSIIGNVFAMYSFYSDVDAQHNYFGSENEAQISSLITDISDELFGGGVNYNNWLNYSPVEMDIQYINTTTQWANTTLTLNKGVIVNGELTLDNTTLIFNNSVGENFIQVNNKLDLLNSKLTCDSGLFTVGYLHNTQGKIKRCDISRQNTIGVRCDNFVTEHSKFFSGRSGMIITGRNNTIANCAFYNNTAGVTIRGFSNSSVLNSAVYNNSWYGIYLGSVSDSNITNCSVYNNLGSGINIYFSEGVTTSYSHIHSNNRYGIDIWYSPTNTVTKCTIANNGYGIRVRGRASGCNDPIYHNNFINNTVQAYDTTTNCWDDGYPSGGNYWSDYTGVDLYSGPNQNQAGSDGIGDTPYDILGGDNRDRYPLMSLVNITQNLQPIADFVYVPTTPTDLDTIQFTDLSTDSDGYIASWLWDFGDETTSTLQNPTHQYCEDGTYSVTLTVTDDDGAIATVSKDIVVSNVPPTANFAYSPESPSDLDTIQFIDSSEDPDGTVVDWYWEFGDRTSSDLRNPTHKYCDDGTYYVVLRVWDNDGASDTLTKKIMIGNIAPTANFTYSPTELTTSDIVQFNDASIDLDGAIVSWFWDFGDSTNSILQNPTHQYLENGIYNVTLTVWDDDNESATITKQIIVCNIAPVAEFTYSPENPTDLDIIQFIDLSNDSDGSIVAWLWDFGDGTNATLQNPTHHYADDGIYTVTLTVTDDDNATASVSKDIMVSNVAPQANFTYSPECPNDLDVIQFIDLSADLDGTIVAWYWDFGDGTNSTLQNPVHQYVDDGIYYVTLTVWDDDGANNSLAKEIAVENVPPVANFTYYQGIEVVDGDNITITLRVAGRKWQSVNMSVYEDNETVGFVNITREPGSPDEQAKNISIKINSSREYEIVLRYLSNGHGANPVWVTIEYTDIAPHTIHFVFNAPPGEELEETLDLDEILDFMLESNGVIKFDASASYDPDGEITSYYWDFGDGELGEGIVVYHMYDSGIYTANLTVVDNDNATNSTSVTINITTKELTNRKIVVESPNLTQDSSYAEEKPERKDPIAPSFGLLALISLLCVVMLVGRRMLLFIIFGTSLSPIFMIQRKLK